MIDFLKYYGDWYVVVHSARTTHSSVKKAGQDAKAVRSFPERLVASYWVVISFLLLDTTSNIYIIDKGLWYMVVR